MAANNNRSFSAVLAEEYIILLSLSSASVLAEHLLPVLLYNFSSGAVRFLFWQTDPGIPVLQQVFNVVIV
jgi:hypothetical protein